MLCCHLYDQKGCKRLFSFDAEPICEVDYCDQCGDCLVCHIEDDCTKSFGRGHFWVLYVDDVEKFLESHAVPEEIANRIRQIVKEAADG